MTEDTPGRGPEEGYSTPANIAAPKHPTLEQRRDLFRKIATPFAEAPPSKVVVKPEGVLTADLSRRWVLMLLGIAAPLTAGGNVYALTHREKMFHLRRTIEGLFTQPEDNNRDPSFRAATIKFRLKDRSGSGGTASLLQKGDQLYLYTAGHVARLLMQHGLEGNNTLVPGIGKFSIKFDDFVFSPKIGERDDQAALLTPKGEFLAKLQEAIAAGMIKPLVLAQTPPAIGEKVAMPQSRAGVYNFYTRSADEPHFSTHRYESSAIPLERKGCTSDSGSPVLKVSYEDGKPAVTNEVVGVAIYAAFDSEYKGKSCFSDFGARDNDSFIINHR